MIKQSGYKLVDLFTRRHTTRWVCWRVNNNQTRLIGDLRQHFFRREGKTVLLFQSDRHWRSTGVLDNRLIDWEARIRIHDLGPWLTKQHHRKEHSWLTAGHNYDVIRIYLNVMSAVQVRSNGFAQCRNTVCRRVAMMTISQRFDTRFNNMFRGLKVRLADTQVNNVMTLSRELISPSQDFKGRLCT